MRLGIGSCVWPSAEGTLRVVCNKARYAFCDVPLINSPDLRARFVRTELALFKHRFETDDVTERAAFLRSLEFDWQLVDDGEKALYADKLKKCLWGDKEEAFKSESWFKVR
jgi:DNA primase large subunit